MLRIKEVGQIQTYSERLSSTLKLADTQLPPGNGCSSDHAKDLKATMESQPVPGCAIALAVKE
jgi:hypothetical protein